MYWGKRKNRMRVTLALLAGLVVIGFVFARPHADKPEGGSTYSGNVVVVNGTGKQVGQVPIRFSVGTAGTRVDDFRFNGGVPEACGSQPVGTVSAFSSPVNAVGHFLARIPITQSGTRVGTLIISGAFDTLDREVGALETIFTGAGLSKCGARGAYSTNT